MDFGRIAAKEYFLYCFPMLPVFHYAIVFNCCCVSGPSFLFHYAFSNPDPCMFCVALCLYHANQLILLLYIWIYLGSRINQNNLSLCCYSIWFGHVGFADGTCLLVANIPGVTFRYTCGAGVLSSAVGCMC